ncbi:MAG: anaerobic ribonucleoside-triphosphate reductase activating protein [Peptostreptococcaceae bacterium]
MNFADIKKNDINNGQGIVVSLWVTGCPIKCAGCHNEEIFDGSKGTLFTDDTYNYLETLIGDPRVDKGFSILGGEPLSTENYPKVLEIVKKVRTKFPNKRIWLWTGYTYTSVATLEIMRYLDVVIDGRYIESLKDELTWWRGSANQQMIELRGINN